MRILTISGGALVTLSGIFCFANYGKTFLSVAFIIGIILIFSGAITFFGYYKNRRIDKNDNNGWIMVESAVSMVLGILVLGNLLTADVAIPMVFGLWVITSGITRMVTATYIDRVAKKENFMWTMATGAACAIAGVIGFLDPYLGTPILIIVGLILLVQGISVLELGIHMPHAVKVESNGEL